MTERDRLIEMMDDLGMLFEVTPDGHIVLTPDRANPERVVFEIDEDGDFIQSGVASNVMDRYRMQAFLGCLSGVEFYRTVRDGRDVVCVRLPETVIESIGGEWYDYLCFHFEGGKVVRITSEKDD